MPKLNVLIIKFLFLVFTFFIYSCSGGTASSSFGLPSSNILPPDGVAGSTDGVTSPTNFYVGVDSNTNPIAHVHVSGDFTKACSISSTEHSQDITCVVDVPEGDLFYSGVAFKYNVPAGMCRYLGRLPYWYYNYEVGRGPKTINIFKEVSTDGTTVLSYSTSVEGSAPSMATLYSELTIDITQSPAGISCVYNKSNTSNGANCCFGDYAYTYRQITHTATSSTDVTTPITGNWGGSIKNCMNGAGKDWPAFTRSNVPERTIERTKEGLLDQVYSVSAPAGLGYASPNNRFVANYYTSVTHAHTGFGPSLTPAIPARTSSMPYFIDPVDDRNGTRIPSLAADLDQSNILVTASDNYSFTCLDEGFETLHKIKMYVREWDTYQDFVDYVTSKGTSVTATPDRGSAQEPGGCSGIAGPCNDFYDLDDFVTLELGVSYPTAIGNLTDRENYFPKDK